MFSKILIANRGEIACRIIRTARRMGIETVAVFSEADRHAAHVAMADEAFGIGPAEARHSYLDGARVIAAARASGAEAIHPGYGFLSENAGFAEACAEAGLTFVGPPPAAIRAMGGKSEAKALMANAGVPLVPGYHDEDQSADVLAREAAAIGYPVLLKASAGGGGKGMRVVETEKELADALDGARREAMASFGDERMLIEKYLPRPRHVEVQVFADDHGQCVALFERDCSIQRRHQKVIEEAPAPGLPADLRARMYEAAVAAARAIGYRGAGTVEFLLDTGGGFHFMEMNTRLQVEHPVTEFITGLDLVEWQLRVAAGEPLPQDWQALTVNGHAIEARLYAEDPAHDFLPSTGRITHLVLPAPSAHLRIDCGVRAGDAIGVHYDPMIAKLIVHGSDRTAAVRRLRQALRQVTIGGIASNSGFLARLANLPDFAEAELDTGLIERNRAALLDDPPANRDSLAMAALGLLLQRKAQAAEKAQASADPHSPWGMMDNFRLNLPPCETLCFTLERREQTVNVLNSPEGFELNIAGETVCVEGRLAEDGRLAAIIGGRTMTGHLFATAGGFDLFIGAERYRLALPDPLAGSVAAEGTGGLAAPMPGMIRAILVAPGAAVEHGQALVIMEAMKMEYTIRAPAAGIVTALNCREGAMVEADAVLVDFAAEDG